YIHGAEVRRIWGLSNVSCNSHRTFEHFLRLRIQSKVGVHITDSIRQLDLEFRVLRKTGINLLGRLVEDLAGGNAVAARFARVGHLEHLRHKLGDSVGTIAFASGSP